MSKGTELPASHRTPGASWGRERLWPPLSPPHSAAGRLPAMKVSWPPREACHCQGRPGGHTCSPRGRGIPALPLPRLGTSLQQSPLLGAGQPSATPAPALPSPTCFQPLALKNSIQLSASPTDPEPSQWRHTTFLHRPGSGVHPGEPRRGRGPERRGILQGPSSCVSPPAPGKPTESSRNAPPGTQGQRSGSPLDPSGSLFGSCFSFPLGRMKMAETT